MTRRPSRAVSLAVSAALALTWAVLRLGIFPTSVFPLTYVLPLLVCVWTRDRIALWGMAAVFAALHTAKLFWMLPQFVLAPADRWANYAATLANLAIGAAVIHGIIVLRERLEHTLEQVRAQSEELREQSEELAQQNEELATQSEELTRQAEELSQQTEELSEQNEELQSQAESINTLNAELAGREALLQTLLDTTRLSGTEETALRQIYAAALELFGDVPAAVAAYEDTGSGLRVRAVAAVGAAVDPADVVAPANGFVELVARENRTAGLDNALLRPDLPLLEIRGLPSFQAVLCAPIDVGTAPRGAFAVYSRHVHEWTEEEFRLAEWCASQCGRVLETLRMQADLREADRRKSDFLATLSHELRNPLAPIRFAVNLLRAGDGSDGSAMRVIDRQLRVLVRLVDDLLDATRLSRNKIELRRANVELATVVQHAVEAAQPAIDAAAHVLTLALPPEPVWLHADADRLAQVVTNLLNNAARYTPAGGRITVEAGVHGPEVVLSVSDTGVGLDPADLERVFEMFTQVAAPGGGGLGIGLALVRTIVELHGGRVEARSAGRGRGSEFRITLPLADRAAAESGPTIPGSTRRVRSRRVLVVDDNRDSAEMVAALLELHGHTVSVAHDAERALQAVHAFAPDVALLDIGLPDLDGYDLAARLRTDERTSTMRLVAVTGWGQEADRARAREAGFDVHLTKPAEPDAILAAIEDTSDPPSVRMRPETAKEARS